LRASLHAKSHEGEVEVLVPVFACSFLPTWKHSHTKWRSLSPNPGDFQKTTCSTFLLLAAEPHRHIKVPGVIWTKIAAPLSEEGARAASNHSRPHQLPCLPTSLVWNDGSKIWSRFNPLSYVSSGTPNALHLWNLLNHTIKLPYQTKWWLSDMHDAPSKQGQQTVGRAETLFRSFNLIWWIHSPVSWWMSSEAWAAILCCKELFCWATRGAFSVVVN
jgi:hypothetical protein